MARPDLRQKLEAKGWEPEYINKAVSVFNDEKEKRGSIINKLDKIVYWIAMVVSIAGNFIISIILIPFLISITNKIALGIIIFSIALSFGFLFNVLLKDIEEIDYEHHLIAGLFIPALASINIFVITNVANHFITIFDLQQKHNPIFIGIIYIGAFTTPYLVDKIFKKNELPVKKEPPKEEVKQETKKVQEWQRTW